MIKTKNKLNKRLFLSKLMRAFIGIKVPRNEKIAEILSKISKEEYVNPVGIENLHINLKFLGEISNEQVEKIKEVLDKFKEQGKLKIKIKGVGFFPNENFIRIVWLGAFCDELIKVNETLESELEKIGFKKENRAFVPHITIARVLKKSDSIIKVKTDEEILEFTADSIELIESILSKTGAEYKTVKSVLL